MPERVHVRCGWRAGPRHRRPRWCAQNVCAGVDSQLARTVARCEFQLRNERSELLSRVGIGTGLVDIMMSTPSDTMRILTEQELQDFGLGAVNVAHRDLARYATVRQCGVEYERRMRAADAEATRRCRPSHGYDASNLVSSMECRSLVMREFGVSNYPDSCS